MVWGRLIVDITLNMYMALFVANIEWSSDVEFIYQRDGSFIGFCMVRYKLRVTNKFPNYGLQFCGATRDTPPLAPNSAYSSLPDAR